MKCERNFTGKNSHFYSDGVIDYRLNFTYGPETMAYGGCAVTLKGEFWYFGGNSGLSSSDLYYQVRLSKNKLDALNIVN